MQIVLAAAMSTAKLTRSGIKEVVEVEFAKPSRTT
jgi:hypothetical protein